MTRRCQGCGAAVSEQYARVFAYEDEETVRCCPWCEDVVRRDGKVDEAKAARTGPRAQGGSS